MAVDVILGLQWGDEGKGKIVDYLAPKYDIVARFQGGPNAGHTLKFDGKKFVLHTIPSGIFREETINVIGNGVVLDPITLAKELQNLRDAGVSYETRLLIANKAHLILPSHRYLDAASEASKGKSKIGSTLKGIGPTYMDKTGRNGLRVGDLFNDSFEEKYENLKAKHRTLLNLYPPVDFDLETEEQKWFDSLQYLKALPRINCEYYINEALEAGKTILAEGAQGSMLDVDYGTYPFVTSSNTITAGVCTGLGVAPSKIGDVIGITKAYCTRVGSGPFPTELFDETGEFLRSEGAEFGSTTGRSRRCGWIDLPQLRYSSMINGVTKLVITKIDVLNKLETIQYASGYSINGEHTTHFPYEIEPDTLTPVYETAPGWMQETSGIQDYNALPEKARQYVELLEKELNTTVFMVSTGPERDSLIVM